jgi:hypothetical protein
MALEVSGRPPLEECFRTLNHRFDMKSKVGVRSRARVRVSSSAAPDCMSDRSRWPGCRRHGLLVGLGHPGGFRDDYQERSFSQSSWARSHCRAQVPVPSPIACAPSFTRRLYSWLWPPFSRPCGPVRARITHQTADGAPSRDRPDARLAARQSSELSSASRRPWTRPSKRWRRSGEREWG